MPVFLRRRLPRTVLPALLTILMTGVVATPVAHADVISGRPAPAVWDVRPATGEVVRGSNVAIAATGVSRSGIVDASLAVDGVAVATSITSRTSIAARATGQVRLTAGEHVAEATFTDGDGTTLRRLWRFTVTDRMWKRLAGDGRIGTAATIAREGGTNRPSAVLALGEDFPDALAGVPLAVAVDGPLLLSNRDELPDETASALVDLVAAQATVHILGGEGSIGPGVEQAVRDLGFSVRRHAGEDRFETAARIGSGLPASSTAVVTSGLSFPDTLAVAAPAGTRGWPILLTRTDDLPQATANALAGVDHVVIVGGEGSVSGAVEAQIVQIVGSADAVQRISGEDRFATAAEVVRTLGPHEAPAMAMASGLTFPDALGGAVDAARRGIPLLLSHAASLAPPIQEHLDAVRPEGVVVYGGPNTISDAVPATVVAAGLDAGPTLESLSPSPASVVLTLDQITLEFADDIDLSHTNLSVWFDGVEMHSSLLHGDFADTVVINLGPLPHTPTFGRDTPVRIVGALHSGGAWRHVDQTVYFRKQAMSRGDSGAEVRAVQERLLAMGYWIATADGTFGTLTVQAVMAFQKVNGLPITGAVDPTTKALIEGGSRPAPQSTSGSLIEVDKTRQVLFVVQNGQTLWVFNTSTGTEKPYTHEGRSYMADTPPGRWSIFREVDGERESELGILWRPKYFHGDGIAIHGSSSVPAYPASHGCVRLTYQAMDFLWSSGLAPIGRPVWVYGTSPGT
jgi:putative cell wall-binding protein